MALAEAGCDVVVNGRNAETLEPTAEEIARRYDVSVQPIVADVACSNSRARIQHVALRSYTLWLG
jgi:3-oxoacyl-[acyl-carrier protein] reductase